MVLPVYGNRTADTTGGEEREALLHAALLIFTSYFIIYTLQTATKIVATKNSSKNIEYFFKKMKAFH